MDANPPRSVRTNGIRTAYDICGEGPWMVLSHSLACDRTMWDEQLGALSAKFTVVRYDTRGHGASEAPREGYSLDVLADDLAALLDGLRIESAHFAGLSMGGMIGQTFALRHPGRLRSLVLCDTTSRYPQGTAAVWQERIDLARSRGMSALVPSTLSRWFTEPFRKARPDVMDRFARSISATPLDGYVGCSQALPSIDVTARLGEVRVPALVVVGEHDPGTPVAMAREIADNLPGAELAVIEDAAHLSNVEQPERFDAVLTGFLERIEAARPAGR